VPAARQQQVLDAEQLLYPAEHFEVKDDLVARARSTP